jgi:hypothetical protein
VAESPFVKRTVYTAIVTSEDDDDEAGGGGGGGGGGSSSDSGSSSGGSSSSGSGGGGAAAASDTSDSDAFVGKRGGGGKYKGGDIRGKDRMCPWVKRARTAWTFFLSEKKGTEGGIPELAAKWSALSAMARAVRACVSVWAHACAGVCGRACACGSAPVAHAGARAFGDGYGD